jgi:gamma-butyrobetaine dioxygenase
MMTETSSIVDIKDSEQAVDVTWSDGHQSRYLHMWLRDNCTCEACGTSLSGQRRLALRDFSLSIKASNVQFDSASNLNITWPDGHESQFDPAWLRDWCNCDTCRSQQRAQLTPWNSSLDPAALEVDYAATQFDDDAMFNLMTTLTTYGLVRVKNVPAADTEALGRRLGYLRDTNYGLIMDIRAESSSWFRALSAEAIPPHTDNVYRYDPTGICLFHCVEQIPGGGGASNFVDSMALANRLKALDEDAFDCLCTVPLTFYRHIPADADMKVEATHLKTVSTVFRTDTNGQVIGFRYHPRTIAPMTMDHYTVVRMYKARRLLEEVSDDPELRIQFVADAGECLIFDNHRVLHARTSFEGASGIRHFRQCHVEREEFHSRFRLLGEQLNRPVPEQQLTRGLH